MQRLICAAGCGLAALVFSSLTTPAMAADIEPALGRWDITLDNGPTPCWMEITRTDGQYAGRFLYIYASPFDLKKITVEGNTVKFDAADHDWTGAIQGDTINGTRVNRKGDKGKWVAKRLVPKLNLTGAWLLPGRNNTTQTLTLKQDGDSITGELKRGARAREIQDAKLEGYTLQFTSPAGRARAGTPAKAEFKVKGDILEGTLGARQVTAKRQREWGEPIELFNGKNLDGWKPLDNPQNFKWKVVDGLLHCDGHSANIVAERADFRDFKLHVEFKVPQGGNSGVYLRGRYEIQVADSAKDKPNEHVCGSLYGRIPPSENACKPAGEWQTYDITIIDHYVTVVQNGKTVIDNQEIIGITGGAIDSKENEPGPIYMQGDHTAVDYRKITLTPAKP